MTETAAILEFANVRLTAPWDEQAPAPAIDLTLRRGELAVVNAADNEMTVALGDTAQGLVAPADGAVRFLGRTWDEMPAWQANSIRGSIGRVSSSYGWLSDLDLEENVTLSQRHQTRRPVWEIRAEARRWAQAFGLRDGLPPGRPEDMPADVLQRAACVSAFLGDPKLIVIETPASGDWDAVHQPLVDACGFLRGRGAAILWLTSGP